MLIFSFLQEKVLTRLQKEKNNLQIYRNTLNTFSSWRNSWRKMTPNCVKTHERIREIRKNYLCFLIEPVAFLPPPPSPSTRVRRSFWFSLETGKCERKPRTEQNFNRNRRTLPSTKSHFLSVSKWQLYMNLHCLTSSQMGWLMWSFLAHIPDYDMLFIT